MDWKRLKNVLLVTALIFAIQLPSLAARKQDDLIEMPKNYPDKYTSQYVKQITPIYKSTGKEEIIYVPNIIRILNMMLKKNLLI